MPTSSDETTPIFHVRGVTAGYGKVPIIKDVTLGARAGKVTAIIGPNGAGKSTLLKAAIGILPLTSGQVLYEDQDVSSLSVHGLARRGVGYVPQVRDVFDPLTVSENLEMGGYIAPKAELQTRMSEVFDLFPVLGERRRQRAGNLSGGEKKMLAIGRVIMSRPRVLLLDEPTANLAPKVADAILREHITKLAERGVAILLVEQRAVQALSIAQYACVMVGGVVAVAGTPDDIGHRDDIAKVFLQA